MASAYAALVSLTTVLERTQHPSCPVSLDKSQIQSLLDKVCFLVDFLENCHYCLHEIRSKEMQILERKMVTAAYAAEDMIESCVVNATLATVGEGPYVGLMSPHDTLLYPHLQKSIQEMDDVIKEAMEIKDKTIGETSYKREGGDYEITRRGRAFSPPGTTNSTVVGFDEPLRHLVGQLTNDTSSLVVIQVVGMAGIGKSTMAKKVYAHPNILPRFDVRAWVSIFQHCTIGSIIRSILRNLDVYGMYGDGDEQLGEHLRKKLCDKRYLVVLDDIWSSEAWSKIMRFFPDNGNGSRILFTTRSFRVIKNVSSCIAHEMKLLDANTSWNFLCTTTFGQKVCPPELERLGKEIAQSCRGLPLAIVVTGGILKMSREIQYWENIARNVRSLLSTQSDGNWLEILSFSYNQLPVHLKPCFLYVAIFKEDSLIPVRDLIMLWVSEGFLRPVKGRIIEEVAYEYLMELVDRNLIIVEKRGSSGKVKICVVHDLLREFCLREARDEMFFYPVRKESLRLPLRFESERRLACCILDGDNDPPFPPMPVARSLICNDHKYSSSEVVFDFDCKLLKVLHGNFLYGDMHFVNLRYLKCWFNQSSSLFASISLFRNLETVVVSSVRCSFQEITLPPEFWELPYLRHVDSLYMLLILPNPTRAQINCVLNNLQTLRRIKNFYCTDEVFNRIPSLKKLGIIYQPDLVLEEWRPTHWFTSLTHLHNLEKLKCHFEVKRYLADGRCVFNEPANLTFPRGLKWLTLSGCNIPWEYMSTLGSLSSLEVLKLEDDAFRGDEWSSVEGEFPSLKHLSIKYCTLRIWRVDESHFRELVSLSLSASHVHLEELPLGIGELTSIKSIVLDTGSLSHVISAKRIALDRQNQGTDDFVVKVEYYSTFQKACDEVAKLATDNFQVSFHIDYFEGEAEEILGTERYNMLKERLEETHDEYEFDEEDYSEEYWDFCDNETEKEVHVVVRDRISMWSRSVRNSRSYSQVEED